MTTTFYPTFYIKFTLEPLSGNMASSAELYGIIMEAVKAFPTTLFVKDSTLITAVLHPTLEDFCFVTDARLTEQQAVVFTDFLLKHTGHTIGRRLRASSRTILRLAVDTNYDPTTKTHTSTGTPPL